MSPERKPTTPQSSTKDATTQPQTTPSTLNWRNSPSPSTFQYEAIASICDFARVSVLARARALDFALALADNLALARDAAHLLARARARDFVLARDDVYASVLAVAVAGTLTSASASASDLADDLALDRDLIRSIISLIEQAQAILNLTPNNPEAIEAIKNNLSSIAADLSKQDIDTAPLQEIIDDLSDLENKATESPAIALGTTSTTLATGPDFRGSDAVPSPTLVLNIQNQPITLTLEDERSPVSTLTTDYLTSTVLPYLKAIEDLQKIIDQINGKSSQIEILSISKGSINVDMRGVNDAAKTIFDVILPWRRKHTKKMDNLTEQQKENEVGKSAAESYEAKKKAEIAPGLTQIDMELAQEKLAQERAKTEAMQIANEKARLANDAERQRQTQSDFEFATSQAQLKLKILDNLPTQLSEAQRAAFTMLMSQPLTELTTNPLQLIAVIESMPPTAEEEE